MRTNPPTRKRFCLSLCLSLLFVLLAAAGMLSAGTPLFGHTPRWSRPLLRPVWPPIPAENIRVFFSPNGGARDALVSAILDARETVLVQAYQLESQTIANALIQAHQRNVRVELIADTQRAGNEDSKVTQVAAMGVPTWRDNEPNGPGGRDDGASHDKVVIIDGELLFTGSYNLTDAAEEKNGENVLVIRDPRLAALYVQNFERHKQHSRRI
jgi:phosphatidylserine/phosphatidylglycerophosphate/cardiolipin synthase-like enzyme